MKHHLYTVCALSFLLLCFGIQSLLSSQYFNATFDEGTHLASGYSYLKTGKVLLNIQHPPFIKTLAALPLLTVEPQIDTESLVSDSKIPNEWNFAFGFLYGNDADFMLFLSRTVIIFLSILLAGYIFAWSRDLYGPKAGILSLIPFCFSPTIIGHSHLVTMDLGVSLFGTATFFHLWKHRSSQTPLHLFIAACCYALALASKFSAIIYLPFVLIGIFMGNTKTKNISQTFKNISTFFVITFFILWTCYFFNSPTKFINGILSVQKDHNPLYPAYLWGNFQLGGYWYYFLAAWLVKTPPVTIALLIATVCSFLHPSTRLRFDELYLILPAVLFLVATSLLADNYGVRYIIPLYPFLFILIGRLTTLSIPLFKRPATYLALICYFVTLSYVTFPNYLSYFSEAVGGMKNGHLYLDDSNIDWGQDLKRLPDFLRSIQIKERVKILYERPIPPSYYGIHWEPISKEDWKVKPSPGIYVVGTHTLVRGLYQHQRGDGNTNWLERYQPIARLGGSLWIFHFTE